MNTYEIAGSSTPINWKSQIEQVVRGYETGDAKGLVHGLQKDTIQNSWGARKHKKGLGWKTVFNLVNNEKGIFLLIQDIGTTGMTGPNLSTTEIKNYEGEIPSSYKLARFSAMNFSGGNQGAGLFGRGKMLFSAASKNCSIFYETITENEGYRANWKKLKGNDLQVGEKAFEGKKAKNFIYNSIRIEPIKQIGSRIIIENPLKEVVDAIKNGEFIRYIEETWWRIILKYNVEISVLYNNKQQTAKIPSQYSQALSNNNDWIMWERTLLDIPDYYKVKKIQLFTSKKEIDEDLRDVYVYRKDMKVGKIPLDVPTKIKKKYFGYIEVDKNWENELEAIESLEHYGFSNKRKGAFQQLKNIVSSEHENFMRELGFISNRENRHQELIREMHEISQNLNQFLGKMDIDRIGSGKNKDIIEVKLVNVEFPNSDNNRVETDDIIKNIKFKVFNNSGMRRKAYFRLDIKCENETICKIVDDSICIDGSSYAELGPFNIDIKSPIVKYKKHTIELTVTRINVKKKIIKTIPFYYAIDPKTKKGNDFIIKNKSMKFPRKDSRRVNIDEKISMITYTIQNNASSKAYIAFHLTVHNSNKSNELIDDIMLKKDLVLDPFSEIDIICPNIHFTVDKYASKLESGILEIRAKISAADDFGQYEIAEELTKCSKVKVFFNRDEDRGVVIFKNIDMGKYENDFRRSILEGYNQNWSFILNIAHPNYQIIQDDPDARKEYIQQEMMKQTIMVFLKTDNYSIFGREKSWFESENISNAELAEEINLAFDKLIFNKYKVG